MNLERLRWKKSMDIKTRNRLIWVVGGIIGGLVGFFYPMLSQSILPIIGLGSGIFYFFGANSVNKNPDKKRVTDFSEYTWFAVLRVIMGFLVGSAIVSTIILVKDIL